MHRPLLAVLALATMLATGGAARAQYDARAVIDRAIQAHGGQEALARLKARHFKIRGILFGARAAPFTHELHFQAPRQVRDWFTIDADGKRTSITYGLNGDQGWILSEGQVKPLPEALLAEMKEAAHLACVSGLTGVKGPENQLTPLPAIAVAGRTALGVKLSCRGYRDVALYFDRETGLLVKVEHAVLNPTTRQPMKEERFFSAWHEVSGLKTPTHVEVLRDGKKYMESDVIEMSAMERLDERLFARP